MDKKDDGAASNKVNMSTVRDMANSGRATMVIDKKAYDFTDFMRDHPGGPEYLKKNAGKVATAEFLASHPVDIIERTLTRNQLATMTLGDVDAGSITTGDIAVVQAANETHAPKLSEGEKPSLDACINIFDFEAIASSTVSEQGWAYYSSGADDEITLRENHNAFHRLWMRPRVMVNVKEIDMTTTILGHASSIPVYLSAVAMCKLGHPEGEVAWNKACEEEGTIYMLPTLSSCSMEEITGAVKPGQPMFFQLYVNQDRAKTEAIVRRAESMGCSALFITCDAPQLGNREKDRRVKVSHSGASVQAGSTGTKNEGTSKALTTFIDPSLNWDDLKWFRSITNMKIILKGIGTADDVVIALEHKMDGVVLSNHGGRQLDFARSAIEVLPEAMNALRAHKQYSPDTFEVYIDGGIRRGTDIFKAIALGAKAVGVGRPALYAMSAFGQAGVRKMIQILKAELEMTMRLMGTPSLRDIKPSMIITDHLHSHIAPVPSDFLQRETYIPAITQAQRNRFSRRAADATSPSPAAEPASAKGPAQATASSGSSPSGPLSAAAADGNVATFAIAGSLLLYEVSKGLLRTIFSLDARTSIHKTALMLLLFTLSHVIGNLAFFLGPSVFNNYCHQLSSSIFVKGFEVYLLLTFLFHVLSGVWLSYRYKKLALPKGNAPLKTFWSQARLILTGLAISAFVVVHLQHFRFSSAVVSATTGIRDMHKEVIDVLSERSVVAFYILSTLLLGVHMFYGWEKACLKFSELSANYKPFVGPVRSLGQAGIILISIGFCSVAVYAYWLSIL